MTTKPWSHYHKNSLHDEAKVGDSTASQPCIAISCSPPPFLFLHLVQHQSEITSPSFTHQPFHYTHQNTLIQKPNLAS
ncbi:hypothetical protein OIU77_003013 [Salix suchowensis]|uniref:Uncharacterized protein n=1 Tax=Salix suchowensis TaxID=1278906 RepID=A0ABQ9B148_9ROSI|nr:hypothetical protein OIU77_003013 [Salix suchowensis]